MYFITTNRPGYVLFCMTPSTRVAVGLTDSQKVHLLVRSSPADDWSVFHEWDAADYSHTDFLAAWHRREEPAEAQEFLAVLPRHLR